MNDPALVLDEFRASNPAAGRLAQLVSLAVRVEPALLRRMRQVLVPGADAGAEADVWFSELVEARSAAYMLLQPGVANLLRSELAKDWPLLDRAWGVTHEVHATVAPAIQLEEEITWLALKGDLGGVERRLETVVAALREPGRTGLAIWAASALPRLPETAQKSTAAWMLALNATALLDSGAILSGDPPSGLVEAATSTLPTNLGSTTVTASTRGVSSSASSTNVVLK
jgi:hypothetical protein